MLADIDGGHGALLSPRKPTDRFYDPLESTASFLETPGPGSYDLARGDSATGRGMSKRYVSSHVQTTEVLRKPGSEAANPPVDFASFPSLEYAARCRLPMMVWIALHGRILVLRY